MKGILHSLGIWTITVSFIMISGFLLPGCGSTGLEGGESGKGSVAVLFTDGPADDFSEVHVTVNEVTLLSDEHPQVVLFSGSRRIDLLSLQENDDLFTVHENIPEGFYTKIRLIISEPEFVKKTGEVISGDQIQLAANGKLNLILKNGVHIISGETLVLHLDLDAEKSIHIHSTGSGKYKFRPVVFVKVMNGFDSLSRMVVLNGMIESVRPGDRSFIIRRDHPIFNSSGNHFSSSEDDSLSNDEFSSDDDSFSHDDDRNHFIRIAVTEDTRIFLSGGIPGNFESLEVGQEVFIRGFLARDENLNLLVRAKLIQLGEVIRVHGVITNSLNDQNQFGFRPDGGQLVQSDLVVQVHDETRIFEAGTHRELTRTELVEGQRILIEGVMNSGEGLFHAGLIILKPVFSIPDGLEGIVRDLRVGNRAFNLSVEDAFDCGSPSERCLSAEKIVPVYVLPNALIIRVIEINSVEKSKPLGVEIIALEGLMDGDHVHVFGKYSGENSAVFEANIVILDVFE